MTKYLQLASQLKVIHTDIACILLQLIYIRIFVTTRFSCEVWFGLSFKIF
jgi:hypothetical protein